MPRTMHAPEQRSAGNVLSYPAIRARLLRLSLLDKTALVGLLTGLATLAAYVSGYPAHLVGPGTLALLLLALTFLRAPTPFLLAVTWVAFFPVAFILGNIYTAAGMGAPVGDAAGGAVALLLVAAVAAPVAAQWSRRSPIVTLALTELAAVIPGLLVVLAIPGLGLNAARLSMGLMLAWRCGLFGAAETSVKYWHARMRGRVIRRPLRDTVDLGRRAGLGFVGTPIARALEQQPDGVLALHHVAVPHGGHIDHVVVAPSGVWLFAAARSSGPLEETPDAGLVIPGVPVSELTATLLRNRTSLARRLRIAEHDIHVGVIVTGPGAPPANRQVALFAVDNPLLPVGVAHVTAVPHLGALLTAPERIWRPGRLRVLHWRARTKLSAAAVTADPMVRR